MQRKQFQPKTYQPPAIDFVKDVKKCALDAGIGSGKSVISLTAINDLWMGLEIERVLIVAPLNVALNTFPDELDKWDHLKGIKYCVLHGEDKDEKLSDPAPIHLLNYEGLEWFFASSERQYYDMVVLDESHSIKDHKTKRFSMLKDFLFYVDRILLMSGSFIGNSLLDLWAQYFLLDRGERLMRSYEHFRGKYFEQKDYGGYKFEVYDWAETDIIKKVSDITFQVHPDDVDLTELTETLIYCDLPPAHLNEYREFEKNFFLEIGEAEIEAFNAVSLSSKLRQFANGFLYHGDTNVHRRETVGIHDVKYQVAKQFMDGAKGNVMVIATFAEDFLALNRVFPGIPSINGRTTTKLRRERILAWNKGEFSKMAIHPRSVGTGMNLQDGGHIQLWISPDWSYLAKKQTIGRVHRTGQTEDVEVWVIVARGTIDEMIVESVRDKALTSEGFSEKLRKYRQLVLSGEKY